LLKSSFLAQIRKKALKGRYWYKVLDGLERGIFNLSSRLFEVIHEGTLLVTLRNIIDKLVEAGKSPFKRHLEAHGVTRARQIFDQAQRFGYNLSEGLVSESFVRYLMFLDFNQPIGWGLYTRP
jgi:hypothetical protein